MSRGSPLAGYQVPQSVLLVDTLSMTGTVSGGSLDRVEGSSCG
ncbi:hypothetical protein [Streptomyces sp. GbtcB6]|nr:hypothetical protein [Streptomyces sp. GbtcB6]